MGENRFHLNNCGLWHFPLKWLLVGMGIRQVEDLLGKHSARELQTKENQQESLQLELQWD